MYNEITLVGLLLIAGMFYLISFYSMYYIPSFYSTILTCGSVEVLLIETMVVMTETEFGNSDVDNDDSKNNKDDKADEDELLLLLLLLMGY